MSWQTAMWLNFRNMYWNVKYIGLEKVKLSTQSTGIFGDKTALAKNARLYSRRHREIAWADQMLNQEEILNHFLNVFAAICPREVLAGLFVDPFRFDIEDAEFVHFDVMPNIGPKLFERVQPDMVLSAPDSCIMMEIKTNSGTNIRQLSKYVFALAHMDNANQLKNFGVLYICDDEETNALRNFLGTHCSAGTAASAELTSDVSKLCIKYKEGDEFHARALEICESLKYEVRSWTSISKSLDTAMMTVPQTGAGNRTLRNLIEGFLKQLAVHKGTGLERAGNIHGTPRYFDVVTPREDYSFSHFSAEEREAFQLEVAKQDSERLDAMLRIALSEWCGPKTMQLCCGAATEDLKLFAKALRSDAPIPLPFRWAQDAEFAGGLFQRVAN